MEQVEFDKRLRSPLIQYQNTFVILSHAKWRPPSLTFFKQVKHKSRRMFKSTNHGEKMQSVVLDDDGGRRNDTVDVTANMDDVTFHGERALHSHLRTTIHDHAIRPISLELRFHRHFWSRTNDTTMSRYQQTRELRGFKSTNKGVRGI